MQLAKRRQDDENGKKTSATAKKQAQRQKNKRNVRAYDTALSRLVLAFRSTKNNLGNHEE